MNPPKQFLRTTAISACALILSSLANAVPTLEEIRINSTAQYYREFEAARTYAMLMGLPLEVTNGSVKTFFRGMRSGRPVYWGFDDTLGALNVSTDKVWPGATSGFNLSGSGYTVGLWDDGIPNHPEFAGRVSAGDGGGPASHGTNVASCMAGTGLNTNAKGMAFQALIRAYDSGNNVAEMAVESQNGMRISNHSYGSLAGWVFGALGDGKWVWFGDPTISETIDYGFGQYSNQAVNYDTLAFASPNHLLVFSGGNKRGDGPGPNTDHWFWNGTAWTSSTTTREVNGGLLGYDTLGSDKAAKNILIVGAISKNPTGYTGPGGVNIASFSSFGPTDDGRIKPDLCAPGVNMFCATPGGGYGGGISGTSFASPVTAGSIALMGRHFETQFGRIPKASTLRAIAINGADEAGPTEGPDYKHGFGQLNTLSSVQQIAKAVETTEFIQERTLGAGQVHRTDLGFSDAGPLKITLVWHEPASAAQPDVLNSRTPVILNDLDLELVRQSDGQVIRPWKLDPNNPAAAATRGNNTVDNVEQISIAVPESGDYQIVVRHKGANLQPSGSQNYSLVISGQTVGILKTLSLNPNNVVGGITNSTGTITLASPQPTAITVTLRSSNTAAATVPSSMVIPAQATTVTFPITTRAVTANSQTRISASIPGGGVSSLLNVRQLGVRDIDIFPGSVVGGSSASAWVILDAPAPAGGLVVYLKSQNETVAKVDRNWVVVPQGATTSRFVINTTAVASQTPVIIRATRGDTFAENDIQVQRPALMEFTASPTSLVGGLTSTGTVMLNGPAPAVGVSVTLSSSDTSLATVPGTVFIPSGSRSATFSISTKVTSSIKNVRITASRFAIIQNQTLTLRPR